MKAMAVSIRNAWAMRQGRQTSLFFGAQMLNAVLGIVVYGQLTRLLPVQEFGSYSFILAFLTVTSVFFDFGLNSASMRLLAVATTEEERRQRTGAMFVAGAVLGLLYILFCAAASFGIDLIFKKNVGSIILLLSPFAVMFPLQELVISAGQGSNRIGFLSVFLILPRVLLIVAVWLLARMDAGSLFHALSVTCVTILVVIAGAIHSLKPSFRELSAHLSHLRNEVREFGREVYFGRIIDGLTNGMDKMIISYFHGMAPVGYYAIAYTMTSPLGMFSRSISTSFYKSFAAAKRIPGKLLVLNVLWCTIGAAVLIAACEVLVPMFFTEKYAVALTVLPLLACGMGLAGLNQPFHAFLAAQRCGKQIKIMSVTSSSLNVALNILLIPRYALTGAALALIGSYGVNIVMNVYYYRNFLRDERNV